MPLETGTLIPELDDNNPLGSDGVSLGDDHIRLIKRAVTGSFPAFVGTTATPKSVSLTEDEINDAALKSEAQTIDGAWSFSATIVCLDEIIINDATGNAIIRMTGLAAPYTSAIIQEPGGNWLFRPDTTVFTEDFRWDVTEGWQFSQGLQISGEEAARIGGNLQIWTYEPFFSVGLRLGNNHEILGRNAANDGDLILMKLNASNQLQLGANQVGLGSPQYQATAGFSHQFHIGSDEPLRLVAPDTGSLLVTDRGGLFKKAGYRNPGRRQISANTTLLQDDEGAIVETSTAAITITVATLESGTVMRVMNRSGDPISIVRSGVTFEWYRGSGNPPNQDLTMAGGSIIELIWRSATTVQIFGNGLS